MSSCVEEGKAERSSASPTKKSLTSRERLKKKADFDRVFSGGKRQRCLGSQLVYLKNGLSWNRFAVCPVRKYGGSVERNRVKRICREIYRDTKADFRSGYDIVMVVFPGTDTWHERREQFIALTDKARLRRDR